MDSSAEYCEAMFVIYFAKELIMRSVIGFILIIGGMIYPVFVIGNYVSWLADKAYLSIADIFKLEMFWASLPEVAIPWLITSLVALFIGFWLHLGK